MTVTRRDIRCALRALGLSGQPVCLHSSLRSFGHVDEGAKGVVLSFLDEGCTILVPTFSSAFALAPPPHLQFERNGWDYARARDADHAPPPVSNRIYSREASDIDREMGAIPAAVVAWPGRVRGRAHGRCSRRMRFEAALPQRFGPTLSSLIVVSPDANDAMTQWRAALSYLR